MRVLEINGSIGDDFQKVTQADLVYKNNHDGTYLIVKNRRGPFGIVSADTLIKFMQDIANSSEQDNV